MKPQRIILIRHGESEGNVNKDIYDTKPDYALELTQNGVLQAEQAGKVIASLVGEEAITFYVSPMWRTRMTFENIVLSLNKENISYKEDPRLREQEWGHLRSNEETERIMIERDKYGTFYYRFLHGESGADVYDRASDFLSTLTRDFKKPDFPPNVVIVMHGMTLRLFLMRWFHWTVEEFEQVKNPKNCEIIVMEKNRNDKYQITKPIEKHKVFHGFQRPVKFK